MFKWLAKLLKNDKEPQDPIRQELLNKVEAMRDGAVSPAPKWPIRVKSKPRERHGLSEDDLLSTTEEVEIVPPVCSMFFIKTLAGTFTSTQFKSVHKNGKFIELKFYDTDYTFKTQHPREVYDAIIKAMAGAAAKLVPCTINEAPTPYGMFSYHKNPYPGPLGEDLIVDIDAIVKKVRGSKCCGR